jgi:hypothetical protein
VGRLPERDPIPSSVQQLLISHFEYNALIQRYILPGRKRYPHLPEICENALKEGAISTQFTFIAGFAIKFLKFFIGDYLNAIAICDRMVRVDQHSYWAREHPYNIGHLDAFPPIFLKEDWYPRYYFDEYENETRPCTH